MTYMLKLVENCVTTPVEIDFTSLNPTFTFNYSNPVISINMPKDKNAGSIFDGWNSVIINLNMCSVTVTIEWMDLAGVGVAGAIPAEDAPTTTFEKMMYFTKQGLPVVLYINDAGTKFGVATIERWNAKVIAGQKDIVNHSVTLIMTSKYSPFTEAGA